ncbi:MAG TPA: AraC family transcriptional regulator [Chitinophagaceae bacterium]|nr:AraC family transcriptional regulator [Chitinophagaceae bacterium]
MKINGITSCYIGPEISPDQFIEEHFFLYLGAGTMHVYDRHRTFTVKAGDFGLARRNHLAKYNKLPDAGGRFEKVVIVFDQPFLKAFAAQHHYSAVKTVTSGGVIKLHANPMVDNFIRSLTPYFNNEGKINDDFSNVKRTELLLVLLKADPGLADILFDFGEPGKIDIEEFMNRHYRYNVTIQRFAYLTGRSISSFKRDFEKTFNDTPSRWLVQKRLEEAWFLINKKSKKPSDIYLDLGFENLSHFSHAFKKRFGVAPTQAMTKKPPVTA